MEFNLPVTLLWLALILVLGGVFVVLYSLDKEQRLSRKPIFAISVVALCVAVLLFACVLIIFQAKS